MIAGHWSLVPLAFLVKFGFEAAGFAFEGGDAFQQRADWLLGGWFGGWGDDG